MNKLVKKSLAAVAALTLGTQAFAAQGDTSVKFNLPDVLILHYVSAVTFDVPLSVFGGSADDSIGETSVGLSSLSLKEFTLDTGMTITGALDLTGYTAIIKDAWAVRALTTNEVRVTVSSVNDTAQHDVKGTDSTVVISALNVTDRANTRTGASITFPSPGMSMNKAFYGNVDFAINFDNITLAGDHTGAVYRIVAEAI